MIRHYLLLGNRLRPACVARYAHHIFLGLICLPGMDRAWSSRWCWLLKCLDDYHELVRPNDMTRRQVLLAPAALFAAPVFSQPSPQRVVVLMCDGFGIQYLERSEMPTLTGWRERGL